MEETDRCCRQHDYCPDQIPSFSFRYLTFNYYFATIVSCECEQKFMKCLKSVKGEEKDFASSVGLGYFDLLEEKPCFSLKEVQYWCGMQCLEKTWGFCTKSKPIFCTKKIATMRTTSRFGAKNNSSSSS